MIKDLYAEFIKNSASSKKEKVYINYETYLKSEDSAKTITDIIGSNKFDVHFVGNIEEEEAERLRESLNIKVSSRTDYDGVFIGENVIPYSDKLKVKTVEARLKSDDVTFWNRLLPEVFGNKNLDRGNISDGYHTFNELYDIRSTLLLLTVNAIDKMFNKMKITSDAKNVRLFKARKHHDGTFFEGMFIIVCQYELDDKIRQFSYHLEDKYWDEAYIPKYVTAPIKWDGHTVKEAMDNVDLLNKAMY